MVCLHFLVELLHLSLDSSVRVQVFAIEYLSARWSKLLVDYVVSVLVNFVFSGHLHLLESGGVVQIPFSSLVSAQVFKRPFQIVSLALQALHGCFLFQLAEPSVHLQHLLVVLQLLLALEGVLQFSGFRLGLERFYVDSVSLCPVVNALRSFVFVCLLASELGQRVIVVVGSVSLRQTHVECAWSGTEIFVGYGIVRLHFKSAMEVTKHLSYYSTQTWAQTLRDYRKTSVQSESTERPKRHKAPQPLQNPITHEFYDKQKEAIYNETKKTLEI